MAHQIAERTLILRFGQASANHLGDGQRALFVLDVSDGKAIIDLRHLPDAVGLRAALETAVAGALASPVERPIRRVRRHFGMTDEVLSPYNAYRNDLSRKDRRDCQDENAGP